MRILVTGVNGQLGYDVMEELRRRGHEAVGSGSGEKPRGMAEQAAFPYVSMDLTDAERVSAVTDELRPDAVVHCAAWTAVDAAEEPENVPKCRAVNADGTENLARAARGVGAKLLYVSTDYVFSGEGARPWRPEDETAPMGVYGQTKREGERAVLSESDRSFIVRTAWVFGRNGGNFVRTMLRLSENHDTLRVVCDQIGSPTYTGDLAGLLADMIESEKFGIYHAVNEGGYISWYDFACEIFRQAGRQVRVLPVTTEEYGLNRAPRPKNSRLDTSKLRSAGFSPLPDWRDALSRYLKTIL